MNVSEKLIHGHRGGLTLRLLDPIRPETLWP